MYPRLVSDSSSLILLVKSDMIKYILGKNIIVIPKSVYEETVERGRLKGFEDSFIIERYVKDGRINILEPKEQTKERVEKLCNLHLGERDVISLAIDNKLKVLCDDKRGRNACEVFKLEIFTALNMLDKLFEEKRISKKIALAILSKLQNHGWYRGDLIEYVRNKIREV